MSLKESFKPTKTKIIIISLILLLYVFTIYTLETKSDKVMSDICEGYQEYMIPKLISIKNGDNETANKIQEDFERNKHKYEDIDELIRLPGAYKRMMSMKKLDIAGLQGADKNEK